MIIKGLKIMLKPIPISLIIILICVFGTLSYFKLSVSDLPEIKSPVITVSAFYFGATPQIVADTIATPLEKQLSAVQGVESIFSTSRDGYTNITLNFHPSYSLDAAIPDIQRAISYALGYMPTLQSPPTISKNNPSLFPVMYIIVDSKTVPHDELFQLVNKNLATPINLIKGVSTVTLWSVSSAIRILLDPLKMAQYGISFDDISNLLIMSNRLSSGGFMANSTRTFSINPEGELVNPDSYKNLIIKYSTNGEVKVSDIANVVYDSDQPDYTLDYFDSKNELIVENPIVIQVSRQSNGNVLSISSKINTFISDIKNSLPKSIKTTIAYDRATSIAFSIFEAKISLVLAIILVAFIIYIFLRKLALAYIPCIVILTSLCGTFILMYILNYTLNNISILALIVAVGFIVDDSIVVIENIFNIILNKKEHTDVISTNYREIFKPVLLMSLSLVVIFLSFLFIGGTIGTIMKEFSIISITMVVLSFIFSLTISQSLSLFGIKKVIEQSSDEQHIDKGIVSKITNLYSLALDKFLKIPILGVIILVISILFSVILFYFIPKSFIPTGDSGTINGSFQIPVGLSSEIMKKYQNKINSILSSDPAIKNFFTITGIYLGADQSTGLININLKDINERKSISNVIENLRKKFSEMPFNIGEVYLYAQSIMDINSAAQTTATGDMYSYIISGLKNDEILKYGKLIENKLKSDDSFSDVQSDIKQNLPQIDIKILRDKASSLGINISDIENALLYAYSESRATQYLESGNFYDVIIQVQNKYKGNPKNLSDIFLKSPVNAKMVPLSSLIEVNDVSGPQIVTHFQGLPSCTISFNLKKDVSLGYAVNKINQISKNILPSTLHWEFQGLAQMFVSSFSKLSLLILLTIFVLYILFGVMYNSYIYPIIILSTIPISLCGAFGSLFLFNIQLSLFGYIGALLLIGIIVKNGIMMVDLFVRKSANFDTYEAIITSSKERFRPILMTGLTSIFGAIPFLYNFGPDAVSRLPLGVMIIGGLIFSQIVTLFVIPSLLLYKNKIK